MQPTDAQQHPQRLVVLAGNWVRVNQDDLGDRRACEQLCRRSLQEGKSVVVDRQNFDPGQRRHWLEIASEFPHVEVGGMVMGTSKEECRQRLLVRQNHPTIGDAKLAVDLLDKFTGLWEEPRLDEGFDRLITLPPLPRASEITPALLLSLLALLAAAPLNPSGAAQRQPRPRAPPSGAYVRPDGFVDDGTWRPPPRSGGPPGPPPPSRGYDGSGAVGGHYPQGAPYWPSQGGWGAPPPAPHVGYGPNGAPLYGNNAGMYRPDGAWAQGPHWGGYGSAQLHHQSPHLQGRPGWGAQAPPGSWQGGAGAAAGAGGGGTGVGSGTGQGYQAP
ncbi:hypothetical protein Rhopal_003213-T1 [Rhodotorula paludigena]|uniref:Uncharacterized protein n=1 Tax=Rhodotorula paludigena TaxID=86838 RepID=A0AAV5GLS9_9BASI|nr:hypothetical protein Rhopal_003213-T1 [Rhodotorula paludigena]